MIYKCNFSNLNRLGIERKDDTSDLGNPLLNKPKSSIIIIFQLMLFLSKKLILMLFSPCRIFHIFKEHPLLDETKGVHESVILVQIEKTRTKSFGYDEYL